MKKSVQQLRLKRKFSEEFKRSIVLEYEGGGISVRELSLRYQIHLSSIYKWIHRYSVYQRQGYVIVEKQSSKSEELKRLRAQIQELERTVGQKQLQIEYLEKLIELASEEYQLDIKKNSATQSSSGSANTPKRWAVV